MEGGTTTTPTTTPGPCYGSCQHVYDLLADSWSLSSSNCGAGVNCDCVAPDYSGFFDGQIVNSGCGEDGTTTTSSQPCTGACIYIWAGAWSLHSDGCVGDCLANCAAIEPTFDGTYIGEIYDLPCGVANSAVDVGAVETITTTQTTLAPNCTGSVTWTGTTGGGWAVTSDTCSPDRCYPLGPPSRPSLSTSDTVTMQCSGDASGDDKGYAMYQWDGTTWNLAADNCVGAYSPSAPSGSGSFVGQYKTVQCA